jgi:hypothetical protein
MLLVLTRDSASFVPAGKFVGNSSRTHRYDIDDNTFVTLSNTKLDFSLLHCEKGRLCNSESKRESRWITFWSHGIRHSISLQITYFQLYHISRFGNTINLKISFWKTMFNVISKNNIVTGILVSELLNTILIFVIGDKISR